MEGGYLKGIDTAAECECASEAGDERRRRELVGTHICCIQESTISSQASGLC